jgi:hypothetical protein
MWSRKLHNNKDQLKIVTAQTINAHDASVVTSMIGRSDVVSSDVSTMLDVFIIAVIVDDTDWFGRFNVQR